jgi:branched-chain amino acid transport system permease protein
MKRLVKKNQFGLHSTMRPALAALALLAALVFPFVSTNYGASLVTEAFIFAIVAMSLDLLMGYAGLVSFGHAAFFGVGSYAVVLLYARLGFDPLLGVVLSAPLAGAAAAMIGFFCVRLAGVGFFMLTLAFAQLLFSVTVKWRWLTGGSDGVGGMPKPSLFGISLGDPVALYLFVLCCFLLSYGLLRAVVSSQFGHALVGVRESETRMRALGYRTSVLKLVAFTVAGAVAGLAGALHGLYNGFASPDALSFALSGTILLMVVLGGAGTLIGPALGAGVFLLLKHYVSSHTNHWYLVVGLLFIACVMFFRRGLVGLLDRRTGEGAL